MRIETTRFGAVDVADDRCIAFPRGLLGFPDDNLYALLEPSAGPDDRFFWLQSVGSPALAFVVTDPRLFFPAFDLPAEGYWLELFGGRDPRSLHLLAVCNRRDGVVTANLSGPIAVDPVDRVGYQLVIGLKKWSCHTPLMRVGGEVKV